MRFNVVIVSQEERDKADTVADYSPAETILDTFDIDTKRKAQSKLSHGKRYGHYPLDAELVEQ